MQTLARLGSRDLIAVMVAFREALAAHRDVINRLNVYPVPDGDTGTNMFLTVESVVKDLDGADGDDLAAVAKALAHGSLMGARGNSGVILSQILRGVAKVVETGQGVDGETLRQALAEASSGAYQAVQSPVEGTILTVIRAAAEAVAGGRGGTDLLGVAGTARDAAAAALVATTEMLPALRSAGVVDSGGRGCCCGSRRCSTWSTVAPSPTRPPRLPKPPHRRPVPQAGGRPLPVPRLRVVPVTR